MPNYSGIWTEQAVMQANGAGNWPNAPGAPTIGTATVLGATSVSVAFTAPTFAGIPATITGYTVTSSPGGLTGTGASSPITVAGLTTGTPYTFTVQATNASGTGPASAASNSVTPVQIDYIEDVFSTYLYSGNSSTQTITNNIDLSTKGGLVWIKGRNSSYSNLLFTSGLTSNSYYMQSNGTNGESDGSPDFAGFNSNGFSLTAPYGLSATALNGSGYNFSSWSFAKAPKFFDVVTYTGNGVSGRTIASNHNMGSGVLGAVFIKRTNSSSTNWKASFRGGQGGQIPWLSLNLSINDSYDAWVGPTFIDTVVDGTTTTAAEHEAAYKAQKDAEQAKSVRATRATKLSETDWRFRSDMTPSQEWKDYCQALRDVPTQAGFPWTIVWPTQPE